MSLLTLVANDPQLSPEVRAAIAHQLEHDTEAAAERMAQYARRLRRHDWEYEFSDDHNVWTRGRTELAALRLLQHELDPTAAIWNQVAPEKHRV